MMTRFGGWLWVLDLNIINTSDKLISLRPFIVIRLLTPQGHSRMTMPSFDMEKRDHDPWERHSSAGVMNIKVEVLKDQPFWVTEEILEFVKDYHFLDRPIRLEPNGEARGSLAFFLWSGGLPRTGAGFGDKMKPGVLVSDRVPTIEEIVLEDALTERVWRNANYPSMAAAFSDLRAPWPPKL
jgi:hypothetical protein